MLRYNNKFSFSFQIYQLQISGKVCAERMNVHVTVYMCACMNTCVNICTYFHNPTYNNTIYLVLQSNAFQYAWNINLQSYNLHYRYNKETGSIAIIIID